MLFNSIQFIFFFIVVSILYYSLRHRGRVWLLLLASCYFYMAFKPVYILILGVTVLVDYYAAFLIDRAEGKRRKWWLGLSLVANIGFLAIFKYFNFINANISFALNLIGIENPIPNYGLELPIGLSFHTFQAMSYTIEVYRKNQKPEKDFIIYSLYVMFYPQLVAGPIERPQNLLGQFHTYFKYNFENIKQGLIRIAWGLFKKVVVADRLAIMVDYCYNSPSEHSGSTLLLATIFYSFQIYCDFSGYSDMAIGCARLMGFNLMENFNVPYISKSISEFWSRWHISLSTWFKDYLYIPLGGNRVGEYRLYLNYFIVFTISGLWHGPSWNFIIWGAMHGIFLVMAMYWKKHIGFKLPKTSLSTIVQVVFTFTLVTLSWVFFRAQGLTNALTILGKIINFDTYTALSSPFSVSELWFCAFVILVLMLKEIYVPIIDTSKTPAFYVKFIGIMVVCYFFGVFTSNQFIYFQF
ncbi:MBOAT family O-acyltransferase [uncultured Arcticibacterium sp.]|uniref:MBOAT family O-acyltransferase n=1 Tax=uncultured Arcticibacterium sp. TaxID=2173042 RepID=UPI0030F561DE